MIKKLNQSIRDCNHIYILAGNIENQEKAIALQLFDEFQCQFTLALTLILVTSRFVNF